MTKAPTATLLLLSLAALNAPAQESRSIFSGLRYGVEAQLSATSGDHTPLWLNANKHGLSSLNASNGHLRAAVARPLEADSARRWGVGYCADVAVAYNHTSSLIIQQAFIEARWLKGTLTVGSKEYPMELKNQELSSGSQTLGINARPVPQVRLALPDYWNIPLTGGWVGLKGHLAYGTTTDANWQESFAAEGAKRTSNTLYHSKAGYLRIGRADKPLTVELGIEMASQFGGTSYNVVTDDGGHAEVKNSSGLKAFWNALFTGGSDATEGFYQNVSGNQLGSWLIRLNLNYDKWGLGLYADRFFEDHSAMFFMDYNGYGEGEEWNSKKSNSYRFYDIKDMMLGIELKLKRVSWLNTIVAEYIYTKYQSGPVYHDHTSSITSHIGGIDNYYNHSIFTGWQHWGQVIGNPLYLSPIYNNDGTIEVKCNRFYAFHLGLAGDPAAGLHYRLLASWQKGFGRYDTPYADPKENISLLAEARYSFRQGTKLQGWSIKVGCGADIGELRGDNFGLQLSIAKSGLLEEKNGKR